MKGIARVAATVIAILIMPCHCLPAPLSCARGSQPCSRRRFPSPPGRRVDWSAALGAYLGTRESDIQKPAGTNSAPVTFIVSPGETAEIIGGNLQAAGLISDADLFAQLVKYEGVGEQPAGRRVPVARRP